MTININELINNVYTEDRKLITTTSSENLIIYPDEGYMIRNKKTGELIKNYVVIGSNDSIDNYEEVEIQAKELARKFR